MARKTMTIAFARGGLLPKSVMKTKMDVAVAPHDPVDVPIDYGQQLVTDKFAYDAAEAAAEAKVAAASAAKATAAVAAEAKATAIAVAQKVVDDAKLKLNTASDEAAKAAAETELKTAEDALAALKA